MKDKKTYKSIYIGIAILLVGTIGVLTSNLTHKPAKPASASGTYTQNTTLEEEQSNCCAN